MIFFYSKSTIVFISLVLFLHNSFAQLTTSTAMTPTQLVQNVLLGTGITATNITYSGSALARGTFNGIASNIALASGVIMSSGKISDAGGSNNQAGVSTSFAMLGDPDLDMIMSPTMSYDASIIQFDFVPTSDTVKFRYVFGSDEYMEYVSTTPGGINDGFGFFISGPGITGPFSNGAKNIALIPGTTLPVTMFNLNLNNHGAYYFDNGDGNGIGTAPNGLTVQYDGFTKPLTAITHVQCGQTYHIKLAIADGGDGIIDSGVFLEAGSFASTGTVSMSSSTSFGGSVSGNDTTIYEGCGFASLVFNRGTNHLAVADTFFYTLSGTATNGVDYSMIGDSVYFAPGQATANIIVNSLPDTLIEGTETVKFSVYVPSPCNGNDTIFFTLYIIDTPPLTISLNNDTTLGCPANNITLSATAHGGVAIGNYHYAWANSTSTTNTIQVNPAVTTTYYATVTDSCGNVATGSVIVNVIPYSPLQLSFTNDTTICGGNEVLLNANVTSGRPGYIYSWLPNITLSDSITVAPAYPTTYVVTVTDVCNHSISDSMHITVYPIHADFLYTFPTSNQTVQFNNQSVGAVNYFWNFGDSSQDSTTAETNPSHTYLTDGSYQVTLIATNTEGCSDTIVKTIVVLPDFHFYFPNAFTPNNNGKNDLFMGYGAGIKTYHMQIFDRWGESLFETTDINTGWDGTYKGAKLPEGVYVCKFDLTGYHFEKKYYIAHVNLLR